MIRVSDSGGDSESPAAWKDNKNGTFAFMESATQVAVPFRTEEDYLVIGDENDYYILRRESGEPVVFAETTAATDIKEFNGEYAAQYLSGDGFTVTVAAAGEEMDILGMKNTGSAVRDGKVDFFGMMETDFAYDPETGTIFLNAEDEAQSIRIWRLTDGGIAVGWYGMTFYAAPVK